MGNIKYEDLQPHVEMLIDALDNRGASPSGISYNTEVYQYVPKYRDILQQIRNKNIDFEYLFNDLTLLNNLVLTAAGNNQLYRIKNIVSAIGTYMIKEFNKT